MLWMWGIGVALQILPSVIFYAHAHTHTHARARTHTHTIVKNGSWQNTFTKTITRLLNKFNFRDDYEIMIFYLCFSFIPMHNYTQLYTIIHNYTHTQYIRALNHKYLIIQNLICSMVLWTWAKIVMSHVLLCIPLFSTGSTRKYRAPGTFDYTGGPLWCLLRLPGILVQDSWLIRDRHQKRMDNRSCIFSL